MNKNFTCPTKTLKSHIRLPWIFELVIEIKRKKGDFHTSCVNHDLIKFSLLALNVKTSHFPEGNGNKSNLKLTDYCRDDDNIDSFDIITIYNKKHCKIKLQDWKMKFFFISLIIKQKPLIKNITYPPGIKFE